jgi:hypothetical protein
MGFFAAGNANPNAKNVDHDAASAKTLNNQKPV